LELPGQLDLELALLTTSKVMRKMRLLRFLAMTLSIVSLLPMTGVAQEGGMVKWSFSSKKVAADLFDVAAKAVIERDWHIYSQETGEGASPTVFTFAENPSIKLEGKVIEQGKLIKKRNNVLDSEIRYYADSVSFVQRVILKGRSMKQVQGDVTLKGTVEFMVCNENMCLPPEEVALEIKLN
jgi:DsbC/DsbD-like thiol-disulfide interchange protein